MQQEYSGNHGSDDNSCDTNIGHFHFITHLAGRLFRDQLVGLSPSYSPEWLRVSYLRSICWQLIIRLSFLLHFHYHLFHPRSHVKESLVLVVPERTDNWLSFRW
jgi:hypothetical protein